MQISLKSVIAAVLLTAASTAAMAQSTTVITPPTGGPGTYTYENNNGGLFVTISDAVRGVSLIQYLGLNLNDVLPTANGMTTPGTVLDFGTLSAFGDLFTGSVSSDIQYHVVSYDMTGVGNREKQLAVTFNGESTTWFPVNNTAISGAAAAFGTFVEANCQNAATCIATSSGDLGYAGGAMGINLGQLPISAAGVIGSPLHFAYAGLTTLNPNGAAPQQLYYDAASDTWGEWLLTAGGALTYSVASTTAPVPLPAAAGLLFSGLAGLGAIGRRKAAV